MVSLVCSISATLVNKVRTSHITACAERSRIACERKTTYAEKLAAKEWRIQNVGCE
jgi:hypothetical protein